MDDATFELLKRIDEGFENGSGDRTLTCGPSLSPVGDAGRQLRRDIMVAVEAEKARRARADEAEFNCPALLGVFDL